MSDTEKKASAKRTPTESLPDPDERFRYIGFGIYPKKAPRFWKSDKEAAKYAERVHLGAGKSMEDRGSSMLYVVPISGADRVIITVVALMLLVSLVLPWVHYASTSGTEVRLLWPGALGMLFGGFDTAFGGGLWVGLSAILGVVLMVLTPVLGLWILASLWTKAKSDDAFFKRLRLPLNLGYVLFFAGILGAVLSFAGGEIPGYASWGIRGMGESYGILTLLSVLSYGAYVPIAMGLVAGVKSSDL
jgi:hypothetical protein